MNADFLLFATDAAQPNLILTVVALLAVFGLPCLMILLTRKVKFFKIVGAVALCYVLGFAFSLSGLNYDKSLVETVASVLVCIAIPLVLFGFEMKSLKRLAKKTAVSFGLVCVSAVVVATAAFLITKNFLPDAAGLTAMSIGLYIGGTPNLLAIGSAMLGTGHEAIVLANTADLFVGGLYFLFLLTAAKPVYSFVLDGKKRKKQKASDENTTENKVSVETATENSDVSSDGSARQDANGEISPDDKRLLSVANEYDFSVVERNKKSIWRLVGVVALAVACFGVGVGLELLVNGSLAGSLFILVTVSVLGIALARKRDKRLLSGGTVSNPQLFARSEHEHGHEQTGERASPRAAFVRLPANRRHIAPPDFVQNFQNRFRHRAYHQHGGSLRTSVHNARGKRGKTKRFDSPRHNLRHFGACNRQLYRYRRRSAVFAAYVGLTEFSIWKNPRPLLRGRGVFKSRQKYIYSHSSSSNR